MKQSLVPLCSQLSLPKVYPVTFKQNTLKEGKGFLYQIASSSCQYSSFVLLLPLLYGWPRKAEPTVAHQMIARSFVHFLRTAFTLPLRKRLAVRICF